MADRSKDWLAQAQRDLSHAADLLIVLRASDRTFRDRIPEFLPAGLSVPCDVFPYTAAEIARLERDESPWILHILREVIWL